MLANCTKRVIEKVFCEVEAKRIETILDLVDRGRISGSNGEQLMYFAVQTTDEGFEQKLKESLEPRKKRQMSEETRKKRYAEKLKKLQKQYGITE